MITTRGAAFAIARAAGSTSRLPLPGTVAAVTVDVSPRMSVASGDRDELVDLLAERGAQPEQVRRLTRAGRAGDRADDRGIAHGLGHCGDLAGAHRLQQRDDRTVGGECERVDARQGGGALIVRHAHFEQRTADAAATVDGVEARQRTEPQRRAGGPLCTAAIEGAADAQRGRALGEDRRGCTDGHRSTGQMAQQAASRIALAHPPRRIFDHDPPPSGCSRLTPNSRPAPAAAGGPPVNNGQ
jgi:hypothetical protein